MRSRTMMAALLTTGLVAVLLGAPAAATDATSAVDVALADLRADAGDYGVAAADVSEVEVTSAYQSEHTGVTHVYVRQQARGLEVAGATATINVGPDGDIVHTGSRLLDGLAGRLAGRQAITAEQAVVAAALELGVGTPTGLAVVRSADGPAHETLLTGGGISAQPIPAKLVYQPTADGTARLAWQLQIEELSAEHWWVAAVDAETSALLASHDLVDHDTAEQTAQAIARNDGETTQAAPAVQRPGPGVDDGSEYRVYAWPLESPNDGPRTVVTNPADTLASPFGWHDTNGQAGADQTVTNGNNVHAYVDTYNTGTPVPTSDADGGAGLTFDFPITDRTPPPTYQDAAVTNLFYWNNIIHDVFYRYGFTEEAGNFQVNNYDRGGAGNDSVQAEAQDGSGVNNANFATPADGSRPRMQMYMWYPGTGTIQSDPAGTHLRDGDLDAGIITHEYGHGISNRLTGGPAQTGCLSHQERMGEGWSDWLAVALTAREGEDGATPRGIGTYALYQPNRSGKGIRPTAYSTDMSINPATYDSVKTLAVPHGVGYVWATMLWEVYWALVADHGFNPDVYADWTTGGNNLAIQLVMDGMKLQPCSPGFVDARNAIIAADQVLTGGANHCTLWRSFAKRGLGLLADQGDPASRSDGVQDFSVPAECGG